MSQMRSARMAFAAGMLVLTMGAVAAPETDISDSLVRAHMSFLASDALNGRGSGTRDEWIAATYIGAQFERLGLQPLGDQRGFVQTVEIERTEAVDAPVLTVDGTKYTQGKEMLIRALAKNTVSGTLQKYRPGKPVIPGAMLLVPAESSERALKIAAKAAGVLVGADEGIRQYWNELARSPVTIGTPRIIGLDDEKAPEEGQLQIILSGEAYQAMASLKDGTPVSFAATTRSVRIKTWNAIGALPGSEPDQAKKAILLSAHLDHLGAAEHEAGDADGDRIYNGADDDASGTTAVLALAEALAQGARPHRTVIFALFGSEEAGGFGAKWVVERPPLPLTSIVANLEFEMIGRPDAKVAPKTLWLTGWERTDLGPELAKHGARLVADPHPDQNFFMRSDNITLARRGVIAQTISSYGMHGEYHQPSDDLQHIDFAHMTQAIQSMLGSIRWLADSAFEPQWRSGGRP